MTLNLNLPGRHVLQFFCNYFPLILCHHKHIRKSMLVVFQVLNLWKNRLFRPILENLDLNMNLSLLDLSSNFLNGTIPQDLCIDSVSMWWSHVYIQKHRLAQTIDGSPRACQCKGVESDCLPVLRLLSFTVTHHRVSITSWTLYYVSAFDAEDNNCVDTSHALNITSLAEWFGRM